MIDAATGDQDVYPGLSGPIVALSRKRQKLVAGPARFGLIPPWADDESFSRRTYNARSETVASKPSFRQAWSAGHFAIALAEHFYEPSYASGTKAERWRIAAADGQPVGIASLWQQWKHPHTGAVIVSFSMLTINADKHPVMSQFHKPADEKRTPLVLAPQYFQDWLCADTDKAQDMFSQDLMPDLISRPDPLPPRV